MSTHPFVPLRHRHVRVLWGAAIISDIGTWVQLIVVGSMVASDTGSALQTGLIALATFLPQGVASPIGGLLADRYDRKRIFARALLAQATATTVLAIAIGAGLRSPLALAALILLASGAGATGAPSYAAMQPDLVPPEELMAMVSMGVYSWNGGRIIGPLLGSLLSIYVGPAWTVAFNAFSFVVMAAAVTSLRGTYMPHDVGPENLSIRRRLGDGWQSTRHNPGCWHALVLLVLFNITIVPFMGLIPIYTRAEFDGGTELAGVVSSAQGIGAILGGVAITVFAHRAPRSVVMPRICVGLSIALIGYAIAPNRPTVALAAAVLGGASSTMFISASAIAQRDALPASRGRVMSIMQAAMGISYAIGLISTGSIADASNLRLAFSIGATAMALCWFGLTQVSPHWRNALDGLPLPPERSVGWEHA